MGAPRLDPKLAGLTTGIRKVAAGRKYALTTWHPDTANVDPETFWFIWRDGWNTMASDSASLSELFHKVGESILVMAQARDAVPPVCPHCGIRLDQ